MLRRHGWVLLAALAQMPAVSERVWAKPHHFWYRKAVPGGHLWLMVDAKHGAKAPLFAHQRLATPSVVFHTPPDAAPAK